MNLMTNTSEIVIDSFDRIHLHWIFLVLEIVIDVIIIIGDVILLMLYFTRKLLGQSTNILVFSVAVGDLISGIATLPLDILQKTLGDLSPYVCKGFFYFSNVAKTAISYTIFLLTMERIVAVLNHKFRLLSPGRCLFFCSLTWFFAAAYNIWAVVIYDTAYVEISELPNQKLAMCFVAEKFLDLYAIFLVLDFLIIFLFPVCATAALFIAFALTKNPANQPGRLYKPSLSILVFAFALFMCFVCCHLPAEIAAFCIDHRTGLYQFTDLSAYKILHIFSFTRGFWDLFIFGTFRHYVCKKEKVLAQMREVKVQNSLGIPTVAPASTSLLDSDQEVSQRASSGEKSVIIHEN
ncbi:uncharacterized protein LOC126830471 [Patella vulgata]|uniref:uncharacterized protein LOC126830471 n=1 Tax=Patella vulgata TaxID=6465 RepID=UPI00217F88EF|nr:uncharacterized protein LOC126830471 [Patella vulgata]